MREFSRGVFYLIMIFMMLFMFVSCKSENEKRNEIMQIVQSRDVKVLLNDLYLGSEMDNQTLARILNAEPSSIYRIRNGESYPTDGFKERIEEVSLYYMLNKQSFSKLRAELDSEYRWYNKILDSPWNNPIVFWGINIVIFLILAFFTVIAVYPILIEMLVFLIAWICTLIFSPEVREDNYKDVINPTIERII